MSFFGFNIINNQRRSKSLVHGLWCVIKKNLLKIAKPNDNNTALDNAILKNMLVNKDYVIIITISFVLK